MDLLKPVQILPEQVLYSSLPEQSPGTSLWVSGATTAAGDLVTYNRRVYFDTMGGVSTTAPSDDLVRWNDEGAANKYAMFDGEVSSASVADDGVLNFIVATSNITDIVLFNLVNVDLVRVVVTQGGTVVHDETFSAADLRGADPYWDYHFESPKSKTRLTIGGLPAYQAATVEVDMRAHDGKLVSCGMIAMGVFESIGRPQYGMQVSPIDYTRVESDDYGKTKIKKGRAAKDLRGTALMDVVDANAAVDAVYAVLGTPVVVRGARFEEFDWLLAYGLVSADATANDYGEAQLDVTLRGLI